MLIDEVLPAWAAAIVIAAILGAIMSTADSLLMAGTSHVTHDIYVKLIDPAAEDDSKRLLMASRIVTVVLGLSALWMALNFEEIIGLLLMSYTLYAAGVFIPVVGGLYWKRATAPGAIAAIVGGSAYGLAGELSWFTAVPLVAGLPVIVAGALVSLLLFVGVSLLTRPTERAPA
jgi:SSS family solute:Na+ symporter